MTKMKKKHRRMVGLYQWHLTEEELECKVFEMSSALTLRQGKYIRVKQAFVLKNFAVLS